MSLGGLVELPVVLHLVPVVYAGFRYGYEGSVLTGVWSGLLAIPNIVLWHSEGYGWLGDLSFIAFVIVLGAVIAVPVERERRQRQRLRRYAQEVTRAQERERARIARDLHDVIAQQLVLLTRRLDDLDDEGPPPAELRTLAADLLDTVRRVSRGLRPTVLEDLGLVPALQALTADLDERTSIETALHVRGQSRRLSSDTALTLYRIAQEALHNAERHADPTRIDVAVDFRPHAVSLNVTDDGRGFDTSSDDTPEGLGLLGMRERAELAGGQLDVTTARGRGTTVTARVPTT